MDGPKSGTWGQGELYEALVLMFVGVCVWLVGAQFGAFEAATRYALRHDLMGLVMLMSCMAVGLFVAAVRKSVILRRAILARMTAEAAAEATARHDALTGLPNRRLFHETLGRAFAARRGVDSFAVMLIDLDRFKPVNDAYGHAAGNAVLCAIADRLRLLTPPGGAAARLGGDEFVALIPDSPTEDTLKALAQEIIAAVRLPIAWNQAQVKVDASIGIALSSVADDPDSLLHAADVAMYRSKRDGRGAFQFFRAGMDLPLKERAQLENDLRAAIANDEIKPFYQPIVALPDQQLVGFEVLARWTHPSQGPIAPDVFIPLAEETGLISDLFYALLREACLDARSWPPHLQIAMNISPAQLLDSRLPQMVMAILGETGFAPGRLETEITETALINDLEAVRGTLTSLQNLGVKIALDDFGTGYSSLYHLKELKFNKLKIDRSFVSALKQGSERAKLVDAIIQLGTSLSVETTAEGIETDTNIDWLSHQGCNFGQGYLFGRPMPKEAADSFVHAGRAPQPAPEPRAA